MHTVQRNLACINRVPLQALPRQLQAALQQLLPHRLLLRALDDLYGQDSVRSSDGRFDGMYDVGDSDGLGY
jgi:hypothetical protein